MIPRSSCFSLFFFNDTATTEIYTLSLHDALPIYRRYRGGPLLWRQGQDGLRLCRAAQPGRSEEHTPELQSHLNLVCRLLLEKKKKFNLLLQDEIATIAQSGRALPVTAFS